MIDAEAYETIKQLSVLIKTNYNKSGYFFPLLEDDMKLSELELFVLFLSLNVRTNEEISNILNITLYRVKAIIQDIYGKTGTSSRKELREYIRESMPLYL